MNKVVKHGEEICSVCGEDKFEAEQLKSSEPESCMKHEAEEWLPEHEEEDDD